MSDVEYQGLGLLQLLICSSWGPTVCTVMTLPDLQFILASEGTAVSSPKPRTLALASLLSQFSWKDDNTENLITTKDKKIESPPCPRPPPLHKPSYQAGMFAPAAAPWLGGCLSLQNCPDAKDK